MDDKLFCNLCGSKIEAEHGGAWTLGHNPEPLISHPDDRCCRACNDTYVFQARLYDSTSHLNKAQIAIAIDFIRSTNGVKSIYSKSNHKQIFG